MVNEFKFTVVHVHAKPDAGLCMSVDLPLGKNCGKSGTRPQAVGPSLRASGPLPGRGLRAAGLLFATPFKHSSSLTWLPQSLAR